MSGWLEVVRNLHAIGGGPARFYAFDGIPNSRPADSLRIAINRHGLIRMADRQRRYELTRKGWDLCEGRIRISHEPGSKRTSFVAVIGEDVPDELIERLLINAGQVPGCAVSPDVIRAFSAALVAEVRRDV